MKRNIPCSFSFGAYWCMVVSSCCTDLEARDFCCRLALVNGCCALPLQLPIPKLPFYFHRWVFGSCRFLYLVFLGRLKTINPSTTVKQPLVGSMYIVQLYKRPRTYYLLLTYYSPRGLGPVDVSSREIIGLNCASLIFPLSLTPTITTTNNTRD